MDDFIQELKEDVRKDQLLQLWRSYGNYLIGALIALILGVVVYEGWKSWSEKKTLESSQSYEKALEFIQQNNFSDAEKIFLALKDTGSKGYQLLAAFDLIKIKKQRGEPIVDELASLSQDKKLPQVYRDLAQYYLFQEKLNTEDARKTFDELAAVLTPKHVFYVNMLELKGILYMQLNNLQSAESVFREILQRTEAPGQLKVRAKAYLEEMGY